MNSAIVIALAIAYSNGVGAYTIPTTLPPTTGPQVCYVNGVSIAVGQTYEDKHAGNEMCRVYMCESPPDAYSHFACYDFITDKCVSYGSTQMKDGCERECQAYTGNGGPGWVTKACENRPYCPPEETEETPPTPPTPPPLPGF